MRRKLSFLVGVVLLSLIAFAILNWSDAAAPGGPGLPPPFDGWTALDVPMNAAVYVLPPRPAAVAIRGKNGHEAELHAVRFEGVARDPVDEYAARTEFADAEDAAEAAQAMEAGIWTSASGRTLLFGKPDNAWADAVRAAWESEARVPWAEHEPAAWRGWLLCRMPRRRRCWRSDSSATGEACWTGRSAPWGWRSTGWALRCDSPG